MDCWTDGPTEKGTNQPTSRLLELLMAAKGGGGEMPKSFLAQCYYLHQSQDLVSPVCAIFWSILRSGGVIF